MHDISSFPISLPVLSVRPGVIFLHTLRYNLMGTLAWGAGLCVLLVAATVLYPLLYSSDTIVTVLDGIGVLGFLTEGRELAELTSYPGYIALQVMSWVPLLLSIYLIPQALGIVAVEEQQGTLDILLSTPVSRWRLLLEKTLAVVASVMVILLVLGCGMLLASALLLGEALPLARVVSSMWHVLPVTLVILCATLLLSVTLHDYRRAGGWAALLLLVSYFIRNLGNFVISDALESIKPFSIFYYYRSVPALIDGFLLWADIRLLVLAALLFAGCLVAFQRRDLGA